MDDDEDDDPFLLLSLTQICFVEEQDDRGRLPASSLSVLVTVTGGTHSSSPLPLVAVVVEVVAVLTAIVVIPTASF